MTDPATGPARRLRVLHLVGSPTSLLMAELSLVYAADCLAATRDPEHDAHVAHVSPDGSWRFPDDLTPEALAAAAPLDLSRALDRIGALAPDVAVPQLFCLAGMTTYRSLLDLLGVPFVGNAPDVMATAAHKARAKAVVAAAGVRVPHGEVLRARERGSRQARPTWGPRPTRALPVVVKPVDADNSSGVSLVRDPEEWDDALRAAYEHSDEVLVEDYVELGREVRCGVLEVDGRLVGLPLEEYAVDRESKPVRGYADKLRRDDGGAGGGLALVAKTEDHAWIVDPSDPLTARVHEAAFAAHRALGCRDYSLFDFRVDAEGEPWFLEAGLYCSYATTSVVAVMAAAAGTPLPELFRAGLDQALARATHR